MSDLIDKLNSMPKDEVKEYVERMFIETWGMTPDQMMDCTGEQIQAMAAARGISVAGIAEGREFRNKGDGKDHRN